VGTRKIDPASATYKNLNIERKVIDRIPKSNVEPSGAGKYFLVLF
jgi:hypothetical protein